MKAAPPRKPEAVIFERIRHRALGHMSLLSCAAIIGAMSAVGSQLILAKYLGPSQYGILAASLAIIAILSPMASFGLNGLLLQKAGEEGSNVIRWVAPIRRFATLGCVFGCLFIFLWTSLLPHEPAEKHAIQILSILVFTNVATELFETYSQITRNIMQIAIFQAAPQLIRFTLIVSVIFMSQKNLDIYNVALLYIFSGLFSAIVGYVVLRRNVLISRSEKFSGEFGTISTFETLKKSWPFGATVLIYIATYQIDIIVLNQLGGSKQAGLYNVALVYMSTIMILPAMVYQKYLLPRMHELAYDDTRALRELYYKGEHWMLIFGLVTCFFTWASAPIVVRSVLGEDYVGSLAPLYVLAAALPFRLLAFNAGTVMSTGSSVVRRVKIMLAAIILKIIFMVIFVPKFGLLSAAFITVGIEFSIYVLYRSALKSRMAIN